MALVYGFVAREQQVLAEYATQAGKFKVVALDCLRKNSNPESKFTISRDGHTFNFLVEETFTYLAVANESCDRTIPFGFLQRVSEDFQKKHGSDAIYRPEGYFDEIFGPSLKAHMEYCREHTEKLLKLASLQRKVDDVKDIMMQKVDQVSGRREELDNLVAKADDLRYHAAQFCHQGWKLRWRMWWQNVRAWTRLVAILSFTALFLFLIYG